MAKSGERYGEGRSNAIWIQQRVNAGEVVDTVMVVIHSG